MCAILFVCFLFIRICLWILNIISKYIFKYMYCFVYYVFMFYIDRY